MHHHGQGVKVAWLAGGPAADTFVIAGGVTLAGDKLFLPLRAEVKRRAFKPAWERCKIVPAELPGTAGVYGAAARVKMQTWGEV